MVSGTINNLAKNFFKNTSTGSELLSIEELEDACGFDLALPLLGRFDDQPNEQDQQVNVEREEVGVNAQRGQL